MTVKSWVTPSSLPCSEKFAHVLFRALGHRYEVLYFLIYRCEFTIISLQSVRDAAVLALKAAPQFHENSIFSRIELIANCKLLCQSAKLSDSQLLGSLAKIMILSSDSIETRRLLDGFLDTILQQMQEFKLNELRAFHKNPLYGAFHAIDTILQSTRQAISSEFLTKMLKSSLQAIDIVKGPVCSDAPEGFTFEDELDDNSDEPGSSGSNSQELILCCFRTIQEASNCIVGVSKRLLIANNDAVTDSINEAVCGLYQLSLEARHKGALGAASSAFKALCSMASRQMSLAVVLDQLLSSSYSFLTLANEGSFTRRSAALPRIFQALLSTSKDPSAAVLTAVTYLTDAYKSNLDKYHVLVHVLNILEGLLKFAPLSDVIRSHIPVAVELGLWGYCAVNFAIRNASIRLISAIIVKLFGSEDNAHLYSARMMFTEFPQLYKTFNSITIKAAETLTSNSAALVPELFPVLLILSRGDVEVGSSQQLGLTLFKCLSVSIYRARELIGRSIRKLLAPGQIIQCIRDAHLQLTSSANYRHGILLLMQDIVNSPSSAGTLALEDKATIMEHVRLGVESTSLTCSISAIKVASAILVWFSSFSYLLFNACAKLFRHRHIPHPKSLLISFSSLISHRGHQCGLQTLSCTRKVTNLHVGLYLLFCLRTALCDLALQMMQAGNRSWSTLFSAFCFSTNPKVRVYAFRPAGNLTPDTLYEKSMSFPRWLIH